MEVSIVIPVYNCPYVDEAIESALEQTYAQCEVIVVDDGSTRFTGQIKPYLDQIHYIQKPNRGTASALNRGIEAASGDYFTWLSADDRYHPQKVEHQLDLMRRLDAAASYTGYHLIGPGGEITQKSVGISYGRRRQFVEAMREGCFINGCTVMLSMDVFKTFGSFDESLAYTHDYDFWLRILPAYDFHYLDQDLVFHRVHGAMGSKVHSRDALRERQWVKKKHRARLNALIEQERDRDTDQHSPGAAAP